MNCDCRIALGRYQETGCMADARARLSSSPVSIWNVHLSHDGLRLGGGENVDPMLIAAMAFGLRGAGEIQPTIQLLNVLDCDDNRLELLDSTVSQTLNFNDNCR